MPKGLTPHLKTAVKGSTLVLASAIGSNLLWFFIKVLIVRNTTTAEFGIYTLVLTVVSILTAVAPLGIPSGVTRFVSIYQGEGKVEEADGMSRAGVQMMLVLGLAAFVFLYFLAGPIARDFFYTPGLAGPLRTVSVVVPIMLYASAVASVLIGRGLIGQKFLGDLLSPVLYAGLLGAAIFLQMRLTGILHAYVISSILVYGLVAAYGFWKLGGAPLLPKRGQRHWELLKFSTPLTISTITSLVLVWADTLMIGRYINAQAVGTYGVSVSMVKLLLFPLSALSFVFLPIAGEIFAKKQMGELHRTYQVLTKWVFAATLPIFFVLFFFPQMSITALFGSRFPEAALPLRLLALGFMMHTFFGTNGMLLVVMGFPKTIMKISVAAAAVNIALNYIFLKSMGMGIAGGALATMISYILINIMYSVKLYQHSRMHPFSASYLKPVAGAAISGLLIYVVAKSLPLSLWMLPVYFVLFTAGYVASLLLSRSIEEEDLFLLERVLNRLGARPAPVLAFLERFAPKIAKPGVDV